jgi:lipopolysaccharide transport system ATP-binding protein
VGRALKRGPKPEKSKPSVWALKDVSFEIERGDIVGIVGANGAGKSTLLKVLSRITEPTTGFAEIRGRVSALLEVGSGFHNELTGRENIFLNAAILGMKRAEIKRKFDEIVDFAGVERFIDTPVKHYSSGMFMRLAFAVAAHLEPEILLIDEVLAVGDVAFQKKCIGKMGAVAREGRTVLFVSHNMGAIRSMCRTGIVLNRGTVQESGPVGRAIEAYYRLIGVLDDEGSSAGADGGVGFGSIRIDCDGAMTVDQSKGFEVATTFGLADDAAGFALVCILEDMYGRYVFSLRSTHEALGAPVVQRGKYMVRLQIPPLWLNPGVYSLYFKLIMSSGFTSARHVSDKVPVDVEGASSTSEGVVLHPAARWAVASLV